MSEQSQQTASSEQTPAEIDRPLYLRRVPESVWNRVHVNALKSRMRLQAYLVKLMQQCEPFPPQPLVKKSRPSHYHTEPSRQDDATRTGNSHEEPRS